MLNIVVPMAGRGSRYAQAHFTQPKPLIPIMGRPVIEWIVDNIRPHRDHRFIFICLEEHLRQYPQVSETLGRLCPDCKIVSLNEVTQGAACTVLTVENLIDTDDPLMIANSDQYVALNIDDYLNQGETEGFDGFMMTFRADDPKWSYCRMRPDGTVSEVVEKQVVSNEATVGIYNFARGSDFVAAAKSMIEKDLRVNGEFYVAPAYNQLIEKGARIGVVRTGREYAGMHGLGVPQDLAHFMTTDLFLKALRRPSAELFELTTNYARVFGQRDLPGVARLLTDDVVLSEPAGIFQGPAVLDFVRNLFETCPNLIFEPVHIHVVSDTISVMEFRLDLGDRRFEGVDVLEWNGGRIRNIRAYVQQMPPEISFRPS